jgi:hypothetical protein
MNKVIGSRRKFLFGSVAALSWTIASLLNTSAAYAQVIGQLPASSPRPAINFPASTQISQKHLRLAAGDWPSVISDLATALETPIIAFVPTDWKPQAFQGKTTDVLDAIAKQSRGRWSYREGSLCLYRDLVPPFIRYPETIKTSTKLDDKHRAWVRLFSSLTEEQLRAFEQGQTIPFKNLTTRQVEWLQEAAMLNPPWRAILPQLPDTDVLFFIKEPIAFVFWRGKSSDLLETSTESAELQQTERTPFTSLAVRTEPPWENLSRSAQKLIGKTQIVVPKTHILALSNLQNLLRPHTQDKTFAIGAQIQQRQIVITKGNWLNSTLLTMAQAATWTELRKVGSLNFLAQSSTEAEVLFNPYRPDEMLMTEQEWQSVAPVVERLAKSPRSIVAPFSASLLSDTRLLRYGDLTDLQKQRLLTYAEPIPEAILNSPHLQDLEISAAPMLNIEFSKPGLKKSPSFGTSMTSSYVWAALRTAVKSTNNLAPKP